MLCFYVCDDVLIVLVFEFVVVLFFECCYLFALTRRARYRER